MLKAYCDSGVFQKVILISPTAAYDVKYKVLPLTEVHEDYSEQLITTISWRSRKLTWKIKITSRPMRTSSYTPNSCTTSPTSLCVFSTRINARVPYGPSVHM